MPSTTRGCRRGRHSEPDCDCVTDGRVDQRPTARADRGHARQRDGRAARPVAGRRAAWGRARSPLPRSLTRYSSRYRPQRGRRTDTGIRYSTCERPCPRRAIARNGDANGGLYGSFRAFTRALDEERRGHPVPVFVVLFAGDAAGARSSSGRWSTARSKMVTSRLASTRMPSSLRTIFRYRACTKRSGTETPQEGGDKLHLPAVNEE